MFHTRTVLLCLPLLGLAACGDGGIEPPPPDPEPGLCDGIIPAAGTDIALQQVAVLNKPVYLTAPAGDLERVFVVEQDGLIRIIKNGQVLPTPFLDIAEIVRSAQNEPERGLLSMAFHPDYDNNGLFYVYYTDAGGDLVIAEYEGFEDEADTFSERILLTIEHSQFSNHNGGLLKFGPDGFLYAGIGDGGAAGDPFLAGQNNETLLAKMLRLDVDNPDTIIPGDNPFANEIFHFGLRNPWRFSFDRETGDLYIADVGQNAFEEVNVVPVGTAGGLNFGWSLMEGNGHCFNDPNCAAAETTLPVLEYGHVGGACSVTGGYVYRGCALPELRGTYFYADFCSGFVRSFKFVDGAVTEEVDHSSALGPVPLITSFGEDARGEMYVLTADGKVQQLVAAP
jgi:glucose/arabinose dehydrogenase